MVYSRHVYDLRRGTGYINSSSSNSQLKYKNMIWVVARNKDKQEVRKINEVYFISNYMKFDNLFPSQPPYNVILVCFL